jgi:hypothetical protein
MNGVRLSLAWLVLSMIQPSLVAAQESSRGDVATLSNEIGQVKAALEAQSASLRDELAKQNSAKEPWWAPLAVSFVVAAGGWGITYTVLIRGFREQDRVRADERRHSDGARIESFLVEGLKYFDGGIQERSIGIGLIEAYWKGFPRLQEVWTSVLANQAVYILSKLEEKATLPKHEVVNLRRAIRLLVNMNGTAEHSDEIKKAVERLPAERRKEYAWVASELPSQMPDVTGLS